MWICIVPRSDRWIVPGRFTDVPAVSRCTSLAWDVREEERRAGCCRREKFLWSQSTAAVHLFLCVWEPGRFLPSPDPQSPIPSKNIFKKFNLCYLIIRGLSGVEPAAPAAQLSTGHLFFLPRFYFVVKSFPRTRRLLQTARGWRWPRAHGAVTIVPTFPRRDLPDANARISLSRGQF